jgi:DNA-3-methyladenine glycosylase II
MTTSITLPKEFNFDECLIFLNRSSNECLHFVRDKKIRKLLKVGNDLVLLEISNRQSKLKIEILNSDSTNIIHKAVREYTTEWFDLGTNIKPFYMVASSNDIIKELAKKYYGLRLIGIPKIFEALCWAIIGQQINLNFAYTLKRKFVEAFGEKIHFNGTDYWLFPTPEKVMNLSVADLMELQFTGKKSEYIIDLARKISFGELPDKSELKKLEYQEAKNTLLKIRGVGEWTTDYVLMKCLRFPQALPAGDVGLQNAIKNLLNLKNKPSIEEIIKMSSEWNGWQAYSAFYLWRSLYD